MKTKKFSLLVVALLIVSVVLGIAKVNAQTLIETTTATGISNTLDGAPSVGAPAIRDRIRADLDAKIQNARNNQEVRNQMLENGYRIGTSSPRPPLKNPPKLEKLGTTSPYIYPQINKNDEMERQGLQNKIENRAENRVGEKVEKRDTDNDDKTRSMAIELLKEKRDNLGKNLEVALKNLVELRKRISSRVEKDRLASKDLTKVKEQLAIADAKLAIAKQAVQAVKSYTPSQSETVINSTSTPRLLPANSINLEKIRTLVNSAQTAIKDAHSALNDVVVAIAKISGANIQKDRVATSTRTTSTQATSSLSPSPTPNQ